jgi:thiol-disulfide isomerase/thioredoxin
MSFIYLRDVRLRIWSALPIATGVGVAALILHQVAELRVIPLPTSSFTSIDGRDVLPGSFLGKPLVINLWATWCPPCRRELPMMADVAHGSSAATFVFINQREDKETIREFLKQEGITLDTILLDPDGEFRRHYMARGLPTTLFIGSDGELRSLNLGEISRENLIAGVEGIK